MSFPTYPEFKDSGVFWLGKVPSQWTITRYKQVFVERAERSENGSEELMSVSAYFGVKPRAGTLDEGEYLSRAESLEGYKICQAGDLVINIMLAWNRGLGFSWQNGIVSPAYSVFYIVNGSSSKFLDYLVRSDEMIRYFKAFSTGVIDSRLRIYPETFGRLYLALPSKEEQTQIARFLDHETAKIDALIEQQQRLIELLKEKRQAVISHAVTKGLDPTVPMKDSGVEWLGEVPAHWEVLTLRRIVDAVKTGGTPSEEQPSSEIIGGTPWYTPGDFNEGLVLNSSAKFVSQKAIESGEAKIFPSGSVLVVSIGATLGKVRYLHTAASANQQINAVVPGPKIDAYFLAYSLSVKSGEMVFLSNASTIGIMNQEKTKELWLALPPMHEQHKISKYLDYESERVDQLISVATGGVGLLQERRSALISDAVTGKIDVRNWQPPATESEQETQQELAHG